MKGILLAALMMAASLQFDVKDCATLPGTTKEPTKKPILPTDLDAGCAFRNKDLAKTLESKLGFTVLRYDVVVSASETKTTIIKKMARENFQDFHALLPESYEDGSMESDKITCQIDNEFIYIIKPLLQWSELCRKIDKVGGRNLMLKESNYEITEVKFTPRPLKLMKRPLFVQNGVLGGDLYFVSQMFEKAEFAKAYSFTNPTRGVDVKGLKLALQKNIPTELTMAKISFFKNFGKIDDLAPFFQGCGFDGQKILLVQNQMEIGLRDSEFIKKFNEWPIAKQAQFYADLAKKVAKVQNAGFSLVDLVPYDFMIDANDKPFVTNLNDLELLSVPVKNVGSPDFAAPFKKEGEPITQFLDVYSLAAIVLMLDTGKNFDAFDMKETEKSKVASWSQFKNAPENDRQIAFAETFLENLVKRWGPLTTENFDMNKATLTDLLSLVLVLHNTDVDPDVFATQLKRIAAEKAQGGRLIV